MPSCLLKFKDTTDSELDKDKKREFVTITSVRNLDVTLLSYISCSHVCRPSYKRLPIRGQLETSFQKKFEKE